MQRKILLNILILILFFTCGSAIMATEIPEAEKAVLEKTFSGMKVRFDGMIELSDGTKYIPVYPIKSNFTEKEPKIVQTVPKGKSLSSKPDFFMFDTNLSFFKIIKKDNGTTIISDSNIPPEVKMGLLPQDLLVPTGFQIPYNYRIMVGDLVIPVIPSTEYKDIYVAPQKTSKKNSQSSKNISGKVLYTTNFNSSQLSIINTLNAEICKKIDFSSIPSDFKMVRNGHYMLLTTITKPNLYIIDADKGEVLKEIKVGKKPSSIVISETDGVAYVANKDDGNISVIDLKEMNVKETIDVLGNPSYLALSANEKQLYYLDSITGTVYALVKTPQYFTPYTSSALFKTKNIKDFQIEDNKIYTLNRSSNELEVYYIEGSAKQKQLLKLTYIEDEQKAKEQSFFAEGLSAKQRYNIALDLLLRRNEEEPKHEAPIYEEIVVLQNNNLKLEKDELVFDEDTLIAKEINNFDSKITNEDNIQISDTKKSTKKKFAFNKSTLKDKFVDFVTYKKPANVKEESQEIIRKRNEKMDFVELPEHSNDFLVVNDKIYILASDQYKIFVLDDNYETTDTISLENVGYYNNLTLSPDKQQILITNISSKEINILDVKSDKLIKKFPLPINVHNVMIFDKDSRL